jgi:hypothetical protein
VRGEEGATLEEREVVGIKLDDRAAEREVVNRPHLVTATVNENH